MPTSTVEDYLKTILLEQQKLGDDELVTMGQIASALAVAPGTVTKEPLCAIWGSSRRAS